MMNFSQRTKLLFTHTCLLENLAEGSRRQGTRVHCYVSLPSIWMTKNFVATSLSYFYESGANQFAEYLTGGIRHLKFLPEQPKIWFQRERFLRVTAFPRPMLQSILERQRWLLRYLDREWLDRESEYVRNSNPEIRVRLPVREVRSNA